jgi:hypothetical protein
MEFQMPGNFAKAGAAAAFACIRRGKEKYLSALGQSPEGFALMKTDT